MQTASKRTGFYDSQEAKDIRVTLQSMVENATYNTPASYTADSFKYPDSQMPFADKHINYLYAHPNLDVNMYLSNLRLMTRIR